NNRPRFGADLENFYSAHNYRVVKPSAPVLEYIVNFREGTDLAGKATDIRIGRVRYSSSRRFQAREVQVPVYVSPQDFLGKRTALFGMTRTGKSNTVKKVNFFRDVASGLDLVKSHLMTSTGNYIESFRSIDLTQPDDYATNTSSKTRHDRRVAAYLCCLKRAGFAVPTSLSKVKFEGNKDLNEL